MSEPISGQPQRILLTEDDEDIRLLVEDALLEEGYNVDTTETVAGALSLLAAQCYDLLFTDGQLPDGTGLMIAERAKQQHIKVLIFTGYADCFPREELAQYVVVRKPADMDDLVQVVATLIRT